MSKVRSLNLDELSVETCEVIELVGNARSNEEKAKVPHRECMAARMKDGRAADAEAARKAGMPMSPDPGGIAQRRTFSVPQLVRAAYGEYHPSLIVVLRKPWRRMHSSFHNYVHCTSAAGPNTRPRLAAKGEPCRC